MRKIRNSVLTMLVVLIAPAAFATPIVNPVPAALSDDIDGTGYFEVLGNIFTTEILDIAEFLALQGSTFGFFFEGSDVTDTNNLIPIFESDDLDNEEAVVNFAAGIVIDVDEGIVQSAFSGSGNIGFFLTLNAFGGGTVFSDPLLNAGADTFGAFPFLVDPGRFAMVFIDEPTGNLVSVTVLNNIAAGPVKVPEPDTLLMFSLGLLGLAVAGRRRKHRQVLHAG